MRKILLVVVLTALPLFSAIRIDLGISLDSEISGTVQIQGAKTSWGFTAGRIEQESFFGIVHEISTSIRIIDKYGIGAGLLNSGGLLIERNKAVTIQGAHFGLYAVFTDIGIGLYWSYRGVAGHNLSAQYVTMVVQFDI